MSNSLARLQKNKHVRKLLNTKARYAWARLQFVTRRSALHQLGWQKSAWRNAAIDVDGQPIPWITYGAVHLLQPRLNKHLNVFEYGSGNSTLWWAKHCGHVTSAEYDPSWYQRMNARKPSNCTLLLQELDDEGSYSSTILAQKGDFDIISIDARERVECAKKAPAKLSKNGVILLDNSERERYKAAKDFLKKAGFREIELRGPVPIDNALATTSIFYKDGNILGI